MSSSYQPGKSSARTVVAAGAIVVLATVFWLIYRSSAPQALPQPSIQVFRSEVASLSLPEGAAPEAPPDENERIGSIRLAQRFALRQSGSEARAYFRTQLQSHGWQYKAGAEGALWVDNYCKPPYAATVELLRDAGESTGIALSMSWNETTILKCGNGSP